MLQKVNKLQLIDFNPEILLQILHKSRIMGDTEDTNGFSCSNELLSEGKIKFN